MHLKLGLGLSSGGTRPAVGGEVLPTTPPGGGGGGGGGGFEGHETPPTVEVVQDSVVIQGKTKAGFVGRIVVPLGALVAGRTYDVNVVCDLSGLALGGAKAGVGFGFKTDNDFRLVLLQGNAGSTRIATVRGEAPNGWNKNTGHTVTAHGSPTNGTQHAMDIQLDVNGDGDAYAFSTSGDAQETWDEELADQPFTPFADITEIESGAAIAAYFASDDFGTYRITVMWVEQDVESDPFFSSVVLLAGFNGVDEATSYTAETGQVFTFSAISKLDNAQTKFGTTAHFCNANPGTFPNAPTWDLAADDDDAYTIEWWQYLPNVAGTTQPIIQTGWNTDGFLIRHDSTTLEYYWNDQGGVSRAITKANAGLVSNQWQAICYEKNSSRVFRMYIDGTMVHSATMAVGQAGMEATASPLAVGPVGTSWIDEVRITKGVARYNSDAGYVVATEEFPRQ